MEQPRLNHVHISLIGDFDANVTAHRAIPDALNRAGDELGVEVRFTWRHTATLGLNPEQTLAATSGIWCVPASPYANTDAALAAIRFARESPRPFLGTCGGFQHALLEYARNVLGLQGVELVMLGFNTPSKIRRTRPRARRSARSSTGCRCRPAPIRTRHGSWQPPSAAQRTATR